MSNPQGVQQQNKVVLCCIDGSSVSEAVCDYASWISATVMAPLKLLHTIERSHFPASKDFSGAIGLGSQQELLNELTDLEQKRNALLIKKGQMMLDTAKERITQAGIQSLEMSQLHGNLVESLIALEDEIRVLVIGIRGEAHEQHQAGIGRQLEAIIRALHKPILVVNKTFSKPRQVMLAYDGEEACRKALSMVSSSPLFRHIPCHVVHVGSNGTKLLAEATEVLEKANIRVVTTQLAGNREEALSQYQNDHQIDLTLMGAFSHSRVRDFLWGSFTVKMLTTTQRPLLLLR